MRASGTSKPAAPKLPKVLPYHKFLPFESTVEVNGQFSYVIKHYGRVGISVLIYRQPQKDQVAVICGDWEGNSLDLVADKPNQLVIAANRFVKDDLTKFINLMHTMRLPQAQLFLAICPDGALQLVDVQVALNKFAGPGMIRDIFGRIYPTQEVLKVEIIDERAYEYLQRGTGSYEGDLIIKPSAFKIKHLEQGLVVPLYTELKR